ncbi:hypothetical protein N7488_001873 [Penicillium malachiteum]|nr:hypothetical protein N7488_001873 [Penicillium malachiteum]
MLFATVLIHCRHPILRQPRQQIHTTTRPYDNTTELLASSNEGEEDERRTRGGRQQHDNYDNPTELTHQHRREKDDNTDHAFGGIRGENRGFSG